MVLVRECEPEHALRCLEKKKLYGSTGLNGSSREWRRCRGQRIRRGVLDRPPPPRVGECDGELGSISLSRICGDVVRSWELLPVAWDKRDTAEWGIAG